MLQKTPVTAAVVSFLKTLKGLVPEQDTSASTNLFYCETNQKYQKKQFFLFHEVGERDQKVGESRGQRDKKCLRESQRPPLCTSHFMVLVLRHGQGQRLSLPSLLRSCTLTG